MNPSRWDWNCATRAQLHRGPRRASQTMPVASQFFFLLTSRCWRLVSSAICMRHRCVKPFSEERLNKQAGPGTKSLPLRDMWQQTPSQSTTPPYFPFIVHSYWSRTNRSTYPRAWSQERGKMEEEGEQILISIHRMSPPHKGDHMTLPLNQS